MDLANYAFTREHIKKEVYSYYLQGFSVEEIFMKTGYEEDLIDNIIDCKNYLEV